VRKAKSQNARLLKTRDPSHSVRLAIAMFVVRRFRWCWWLALIFPFALEWCWAAPRGGLEGHFFVATTARRGEEGQFQRRRSAEGGEQPVEGGVALVETRLHARPQHTVVLLGSVEE